MTDPYRTLGLSPGATDEDIKKAYKRLAKKYHPDVTGNDPKAAKMMQEINAAYDELINHKGSSSYHYGGQQRSGYSGYSGNSGYNSSYNSQNNSYQTGDDEVTNAMRAAVNFINSRQYWQALNALSSVPSSKRNGRWYYLSSIAKSYSGDNIGAKGDIYEALRREPQNEQYKTFRDRLENTNTTYNSYRTTNYGKSNSLGGFLSCCLPCLIYNLLCNLCC